MAAADVRTFCTSANRSSPVPCRTTAAYPGIPRIRRRGRPGDGRADVGQRQRRHGRERARPWTCPHTDIPADQFRARWNETIAAYGYGPTLDPLKQDDGEQLGLLLDEQRDGEWLRIKVSTHPDGAVTQSHVEASPRNADQFSQALAGAAAMISASSSLDPLGAEQLVTDTVGPAETMPQGDQLLEDVERDGKRYSFTVTPQNPAGEIVAHMTFVMTALDDE